MAAKNGALLTFYTTSRSASGRR